MTEHLSKAVLARYSLQPDSVRRREVVEEHLRTCEQCRTALSEERLFNEALSDPDTWSRPADAPGFAELMRLAESGPAEDAQAEALLSKFDDAPAARFAWEDLPNDPRFRFAGAVRALCKRANDMCGRDPRYALALANAASRIATALPSDRYPVKALHAWRGEAHKERANALFVLGKLPDVLNALDDAEAEFDQTGDVGLGHVAVLYIRGNVFYEQDELAEAESLAESSASAALHLGDEDRFIRARHLLGKIRFERRDFDDAAATFEGVLAYGEKIESPVWIARAALPLGNCQIELGRLREARRSLELALRRFTDLQHDAEVTKTRWAMARLSFAEGATSDGMQRMRTAIAELTEFEMLTDSAVAAVDLAEMMYQTNRLREIPKLLDGVVETFTRAGKFTGALTALAYIKEAAAAGKLTKRVARDVRRFLSRTEYQPQLVFIPPAEL